jgi:hypothetical protein
MLSFSFLSRVSLLCFLKKWPKIDLCFGLFFSLQRKQTSVFYHENHSQTTSSLYLFINSFTHNNTYYKTTHIKIHHSERRRANANAIVFAAALSLSHKCCCCLNDAKERARLFLSFFKSEIHQIIFLSSVDNIKRRGIRF